MENFEYAILGQGSAAFAAAIKADSLGVKTVMIGKNITEGTILGGTCVNVGCVPSKRLITVAAFRESLYRKRFAGINYRVGKTEYAKILEEKELLLKRFREEKYENVLAGLGNVTYINELGSFIDKNTIRAGGKEIRAEKILIATGARSSVPNVKGAEKVNYLTNETALSLRELPTSLIVVGGRALGLEFAQMFGRLGVKVIVLQRSESIIPNWEPEIAAELSKYLREEGIDIQTNVSLSEISEENGTMHVEAKVNGTDKSFESEAILFATGRQPNTDTLNAEAIGIELDKSGYIKIGGKMNTTIGNIYAAGDVTGEPMLETFAAKQGNVATTNALQGKSLTINKDEVPKAIFTDPEAASVGLTEEEAHGKGIKCSCNALPLSLVPKASIISDTRGVVKVVIDYKSHRIIGMHILAPHGADLIHEGVLAVKFGLSIDDIIDTVHVFPTLSEAIKLAAQSFYQDVSKLSCCTI